MHVLLLPSWYPASPTDIAGSFFREQAIALAKSGHRVGVIHPKLRSLRQFKKFFAGEFGTEFENDGGVATLRGCGMAWLPRMPGANRWFWLRKGRQLFQKYVEQCGLPNVIHVHSMLNAGLLSLEIKHHFGIPYVVTEHLSAFARGLVPARQIQLAKNIAHGAHRRFAVSLSFSKFLSKKLGGEAGEWEVMPNIVEQRFLDRPLPGPGRIEDGFRFITIALLNENKRVHHLLQAFAQAFGDDRRVVLDIGGDGTERPKLEALARDLGIQNRVRFLGTLSRDQVADAMVSANAFVLGSKYETFGVVVIEALALGKPVIATRCGGPERIVREQDGLLVPTDNVDALADAMRHMRNNASQYVPENLREGCRQRFSEEAVVKRLTQVYAGIGSVRAQ
ncbi:MAG: glycosyltransferase [Desulfococcaceae bacterium]